jgi:hypothetical protein
MGLGIGVGSLAELIARGDLESVDVSVGAACEAGRVAPARRGEKGAAGPETGCSQDFSPPRVSIFLTS